MYLLSNLINMENLFSIADVSKETLEHIFSLSSRYYFPTKQLQGKNIVFAFAKPSLRTKIATEVAISQLGGNVIHIEPDVFYGGKVFSVESEQKLNTGREDIKDTVKNISEWCDALFARVFSHQTLLDIHSYTDELKIVNALSDEHHPMQAITDLFTMRELFWSGKMSVTFVGDSNNVAFSLAEILLKFGHEVRIASPEKYSFDTAKQHYLKTLANTENGTISFLHNPIEAVKWADFIYADTFVSMGEEWVFDEKIKHFNKYQVNQALMDHTGKETYFMHCLPAHRGIEVTDDVMDSTHSLIYQQARNRMVTARGVFLTLFNI